MFDQSHCRFIIYAHQLVDNLCVDTQHNWVNKIFYPNSTLIDPWTPLIKCSKLNILLPNKKKKNCLKLHNGCISKFSTNANALDYFYTNPNINYTSKTDILALMVNSSPRGEREREREGGGGWNMKFSYSRTLWIKRWDALNFRINYIYIHFELCSWWVGHCSINI